jgi:multicomponent K+:H+ antiporter subunit A
LLSRVNAGRIFDVQIVNLVAASRMLKRLFSSRRLQPQLSIIVCVALAGALIGMWDSDFSWGNVPASAIDPAFAAMWLVGAACAIGAALQAKYHRLAALIMVGGAGLITCLTFVWFSAPDLALTQITVEVVTVVLILLGMRWLPRRIEMDDRVRRATLRARSRRARDLAIAVLAGAGLASLAYAILTRPPVRGIAPFFLDHALEQAGGRNVVNVILVDFRSFDTLGEITVVGIVALTVYALLRRFRPAPESVPLPRAQREQIERHGHVAPDPHELLPQGYMKIPAVLVRMLLPMAAVVSVYLLLRGHNAPGGGFVGGLVLAIAILLQYIVGGTVWVESRTRIHPSYWIALGLLSAAAAGIGACLASYPFLTALAASLHLPLIGEVHLSSVLLFDLGVYMLVIGATVLLLIAIAHQSLRSHRKLAAEAAEATDMTLQVSPAGPSGQGATR